MGRFRFLVFGVLLGLVQGSLEKTWGFGGPAPNLLLIYVLWLGISGKTRIGMWSAFLGGLALDAVADLGVLGVSSLAGTAVAYLPEWARLIVFPENRFSGLLLVAVGTLFQSMIVLSIVQTLAPEPLWSQKILYQWLISIILNGATWLLLGVLVSPKETPEYSA